MKRSICLIVVLMLLVTLFVPNLAYADNKDDERPEVTVKIVKDKEKKEIFGFEIPFIEVPVYYVQVDGMKSKLMPINAGVYSADEGLSYNSDTKYVLDKDNKAKDVNALIGLLMTNKPEPKAFLSYTKKCENIRFYRDTGDDKNKLKEEYGPVESILLNLQLNLERDKKVKDGKYFTDEYFTVDSDKSRTFKDDKRGDAEVFKNWFIKHLDDTEGGDNKVKVNTSNQLESDKNFIDLQNELYQNYYGNDNANNLSSSVDKSFSKTLFNKDLNELEYEKGISYQRYIQLYSLYYSFKYYSADTFGIIDKGKMKVSDWRDNELKKYIGKLPKDKNNPDRKYWINGGERSNEPGPYRKIYMYNPEAQGNYNPERTVANARKDVEGKTGNLEVSVDDIVKNFDVIMKYLYGYIQTPLLGDTEDVPQLDDTQSAYFMSKQDWIDVLFDGSTVEGGQAIIFPNTDFLESLTVTDKGIRSLARLYHATRVAWSSFHSIYGDDGKKKDDKAEEILKLAKPKTETDENGNETTETVLSTEQLAVVKRYQAFGDGLNYLGWSKDRWTYLPAMNTFWDYYEKLKPYFSAVVKDAYESETDSPFSEFFNTDDEALPEWYKKGVALSATFTPLRTNMYDPVTVALADDIDWVTKWYSKWGFFRKAVYINTSGDAAVEDYIEGKKGKTRIARLSDMFKDKRDIVLYVDDNFYNVKDVAEAQTKYYEAMKNTEEQKDKKPWTLSDLWTTDIKVITKTGPNNVYSTKLKNKTTEYGKGLSLAEMFFNHDQLMSDDEIKAYIEEQKYSPMQAYAIVCGIYRHRATFNIAQKECKNPQPIFVSSPNLAGIEGTGLAHFNTIYNHAMVANLKSNEGYDYKSYLDLESPLYVDIFGNIVTESGLVVIPAMSNATLVGPKDYTPYTLGFLSLYNQGDFKIEAKYHNSSKYMDKWFAVNNKDEKWYIADREVDGDLLELSNISTSNYEQLKVLYKNAQDILDQSETDPLIFKHRVPLMLEVMRGAPIEFIDKDFEGIVGARKLSTLGLTFAVKLDEITKNLMSSSNGNSVLSLPNFAFMKGIEYIVLFGYKLLFAVMFLVLMGQVYIDAVQGLLSWRTFTKFIVTLMLFVIIATGIPSIVNFSYYGTNRVLLKNEALYTAMLNYEKRSEGKEVGVTDITEPQSTSKFYLKVDDVKVPWMTMTNKILTANVKDTMADMYKEALDDSPMSIFKGVQQKANGLYMDVDDILNSTSIEYSVSNKIIYSVSEEDKVASIVTPYYMILDALISRVNMYNMEHPYFNSYTRIQDGGKLKIIGAINNYFASEEFMEEGMDILNMHQLYGDEYTNYYNPDSDLFEKSKKSIWYTEDIKPAVLNKNIIKLDQAAREFAVNNRMLMGKVTDEAFLKIMALYLAIEHNQIFGIPVANHLDIFDIDTLDLIRLSSASRDLTLGKSALSFSRFIFEIGNSIAVVFAAILVTMFYLVSIVRPISMVILTIVTIVSLIVYKLILRKEDRTIEGYLITLGLICAINVLYAVSLKASFLLPQISNAVVANLSLQIMIQVIYIMLTVYLVYNVVTDWKAFGFNNHIEAMAGVVQGIGGLFGIFSKGSHMSRFGSGSFADKRDRANKWYYDSFRDRRYSRGDSMVDNSRTVAAPYIPKFRSNRNKDAANGDNILQEMFERDERRKDNDR